MRQPLLRLVGLVCLAVLISVGLAPSAASDTGFVHGVVVAVDGEDYYLAGAPDGPGGAQDVPGHYWVTSGPDQLVGKHFNSGPFGAPNWWSSDAPDGELLYLVHGVVDTWSPDKAARYAALGYVHYHELVSVEDGQLHPTHVVWLRHHALTSFTLDGGPRPEFAHEVTAGIDRDFIPNWSVPYDPVANA
jgi:hypothetical protein